MLIPIFLGVICKLLHESNAFNIDEVNSIHYDIDIIGNPIRKGKFDEAENVLVMINRLGQEYACTLPSLPSDMKGLGSKDDQTLQEDNIDIAELLRPMKAAPCLVTSKGWWTYEFCYGQIIKQYHLEDGKSRGSEMILGVYESEYDWSNGGKGGADASDSSNNNNRLQRFHSQFYNNGTKCDLTGESRRTEVRFKCESDMGDYIERVDEPESCRYIVTVATTRVCHHPYLRPHPSRTPHPITCAPLLDDNKFTEYTHRLNEKRRAAEEEAAALVLKQQREGGATIQDKDKISIEFFSFGDSIKAAEKLFDESNKESKSDGVGSAGSAKPKDAFGTATQVQLDDEDKLDKDPEQGGHEAPNVKPKTSLSRIIHDLIKSKDDVDSDNLGSNILQFRDQLSEDTAQLQQVLDETLTDLERELDSLSQLAANKGEDGKLHLWKALADKVKDIREKNLHLNGQQLKVEEPERGTPEWLQWRLSKNGKAIAKARQTLLSLGEKKKAAESVSPEDSKAWLDGGAGVGKGRVQSKEEQDKEDDDFLNLFSGQFMDEILEQYMADQDAGSKEGEAVTTKTKEIKRPATEDNSVVISSLQESIKEKLKRSGLDVNKHKIEVKILTPKSLLELGDEGQETLSAEQAHSVETLVVKLMGAQKEEILEREKHGILTENYNFAFDELESPLLDQDPADEEGAGAGSADTGAADASEDRSRQESSGEAIDTDPDGAASSQEEQLSINAELEEN